MDINTSHLLFGALGIVIGMAALSLWQARGNLTATSAMEKLANIPNLTKLLYNDALIVVRWLEQVTKPANATATAQEIAILNRNKRAQAMAVLQRRASELLRRPLTPEEVATIDRLVEAVVFVVKTTGVQLPQVTLTGDNEWLEGLQDDSSALPRV